MNLSVITLGGQDYNIKDTQAREDANSIVKVQDTQPIESANKIWLKETTPEGVQVPTLDEFNDLEDDITNLKAAIGNLRNLTTDEKTNIVGAVNEINNRFITGIETAVDDWLDEHPDATTTVQDASLTEIKFSDSLILKTVKDYVTPQMYGAKGDGVSDDYQAWMDALDQCARTGKTLVVPSGDYYISNTIHLENLPYRVIGIDYRYRIVILGIDPRKCRLLFDESCTYGIYFNKGNNDYRGFTIDGIGVYTKAYTDTSMRPAFTAIYLQSAPDTILKNIWIEGCSYGIYIKHGWNTQLDNIHVSRSVGGITFDGYDEESNVVGYCDNIKCSYLYVGSYPTLYGIKLKGVVGGRLVNINAENANTANAVVIESSSNITIENFYIEWFRSEAVFKISAIDLTNYQFIPKNIKISNGKIYRCDGYSFYLLNLVNSEISYVSQSTNYDAETPYNIGKFIGTMQKSDGSHSRYVNHVNLIGNILLEQDVMFMRGQYRTMFIFNGMPTYNNPYYKNNYYAGTCYMNQYMQGQPDTIWMECVETGSCEENPSTTASNEANSKKLIVMDSSRIHVGTFIDVGDDRQLQVLRKDGTNIYVHKQMSSAHTDTNVTIHAPVFTNHNK